MINLCILKMSSERGTEDFQGTDQRKRETGVLEEENNESADLCTGVTTRKGPNCLCSRNDFRPGTQDALRHLRCLKDCINVIDDTSA